MNADPRSARRLAVLNGQTPSFVTADQIQPEPVEWHWKNYLPIGKLVLLDGDPGLGKSAVALDWAARTTYGGPMPDGTRLARTGGVVILAAEDGDADTIVPRLIAAGADRSKVVVLHAADHPDSFLVPDHLDRLQAAIEYVGAAMVILDPITAYVTGDINKDQEIRRCLRPFLALIHHGRVVAVGTRHLNKDASLKALYRGGGSIAMIGQARVGLIVGSHPDREGEVLMACSKANLGPKPPSLCYRIVESNSGVARVEWLGATDHAADQLVEAGQEANSKAEQVIREKILPRLQAGPVPAKEADDILAAEGVTSRSSINRHKKAAGIYSRREGRPGEAGTWWWLLPGQSLPP